MDTEESIEVRLKYLVPMVEVWTNNLGELVEGRISYDEERTEYLEDVQETIDFIKANPQEAVWMKLYGFNLHTLKEAFYE